MLEETRAAYDWQAAEVEKRSAELAGQGITQDEARRQALVEFRDKYEFTAAAHQ